MFWEGERLELGDGLTLLRLGGHFAGAQVLHWAGGADGRGVLLAGDILQVVPDRRFVSFMYSYPNYIPLPAATVRRMVETLEPYAFERVYGAWFGAVVRARRQGGGAPLGGALHPGARDRALKNAESSSAPLRSGTGGGLPQTRRDAMSPGRGGWRRASDPHEAEDEPCGLAFSAPARSAAPSGAPGRTAATRWRSRRAIPTIPKLANLALSIGPNASAGAVPRVVEHSEVVVLATPWTAVRDMPGVATDWSGKILIDCTNPLRPDFKWLEDDYQVSGAERIAAWAKGASVFKTLNHTGANNMANPAYPDGRPVMFVCGDDAGAKPTVLKLVAELGFEAVDAGAARGRAPARAACHALDPARDRPGARARDRVCPAAPRRSGRLKRSRRSASNEPSSSFTAASGRFPARMPCCCNATRCSARPAGHRLWRQGQAPLLMGETESQPGAFRRENALLRCKTTASRPPGQQPYPAQDAGDDRRQEGDAPHPQAARRYRAMAAQVITPTTSKR